MKQPVLLFIAIFGLYYVNMKAQAPQLAKVTPPSPNAVALQKYGDIPVSPYTGIPDISIPVYTAKFRDITVPISLSYHASGIKVAEEASPVGLGWVLNAGGCISRNIINGDDFFTWLYFNNSTNTLPDFTYNQGPRGFIVEGCVLPMFSRTTSPTMYDLDLASKLGANYEFQPDQYSYNFQGRSGKFTLKRNMQAAIQNVEKLAITCQDTDGNSFQIKDEHGVTYDFMQYESVQESGLLKKTAWYLTKITSPLGNTVTFTYTTIANQFVATVGSYVQTKEDYATPGVFSDAMYSGFVQPPQAGIAPAKNYTYLQLSTIDFTTGIVKFNYSDRLDVSGDKMLDSISVYAKDPQGVANATPLKTVYLLHNYFDKGIVDDDYNSATLNNSKRLKLTQVIEKGYYGGTSVSTKPYTFTYYEGGTYDLPSKTSFARDHWGYYNGKTSNTSLIPNFLPASSPDEVSKMLGIQGSQRDPDKNYTQAWSLSSIQYPTGGSTEFQYEANDFDEVLSQANDASYFGKTYNIVQANQYLRYDNATKLFSAPQKDTADLRNQYTFVSNYTGQSQPYAMHLMAVFRFSGSCSRTFYSGQIYFDILDSSGTNIVITKDVSNFYACSTTVTNNCARCQPQSGYSVLSYNTDMQLPPAKYVIRMHADPSFNGDLQDVAWTFTYYVRESATPTYATNGYTYATGGGLRVKQIIDHDAVSSANDKIKRFVYHYTQDKNGDGTPEEYSYGIRMVKPGYSYFYSTYEIVQTDCVGDGARQTGCPKYLFWSDHLVRCSDSNLPLNGSSGGPVIGYSQVTVLEGENGENGKTVYQYVNKPDIINPYNSFNGLPLRPPYGSTISEPLNGRIISETVYAGSEGAGSQKIKEVKNIYESTMDNSYTLYGMETRPYQKYYTVAPTNRGQDATAPCERLLMSYWHQKTAWNYLSSTTEKTFASGDTTQYHLVATNYYYDDTAHLQPTRVVTANSKGDVDTTIITYPLTYRTTTATDALTKGLANLKDKHLINVPVEKYVKRTNNNGSNVRVTSAGVTSFDNTLTLPALAYTTETATPITNFAALNITSSGSTLDTRYKIRVYFDAYDNFGNILQQHKANDISSAYVWDYKSTLPIAECVNAASNEIAFTSFEWDGAGNWTVPSIVRSTTEYMTGKKSYVLTNGNITKSIANTAKAYVVSLWSKSGTATVNGTAATTTFTRNGWTYNEWIIANGTVSITISGSAAIDELRLHPINAQMSTYTYEPLIGMTAQCDPSGKMTYYEYDDLGRLQRIKDQDGNIVKAYEYNYKH